MQNLARAFETNRLLVLDDGTGPTAFVYDATGNTTNDGTRTFAYDARNRMTTADGHSYAYNALAQRVYKSAGIPATDPAALIAQLEAEITEIEANIALWTSQAQQATIAGLAAEASAQAAHAQADALIAEAAAHREAQHQAAAAAWTAQAASYRATATDLRSGIQPGGGLIQRIVNAILNALASVADALANIADDRAEARGQDAQQAALAALAAEAEAANQTAIAANTSAQAQAALADAVALQAQIAAAQESMQGLEQQIAELMTNPPVGGALVFTYDASGRLIGEYTTDGTPVRRYLWLEDLPLALIDQTGIHFIHSDHLNTPQAVTDSNGTLVWAADYTPFGEVTETVSQIEMNLRFPGQYHDRETGLHQNWHREYDPMTGRYTQSDPIGLAGGLNLFSYAEMNPGITTDFLGLDSTPDSPSPTSAKAFRFPITSAICALARTWDSERERQLQLVDDIYRENIAVIRDGCDRAYYGCDSIEAPEHRIACIENCISNCQVMERDQFERYREMKEDVMRRMRPSAIAAFCNGLGL